MKDRHRFLSISISNPDLNALLNLWALVVGSTGMGTPKIKLPIIQNFVTLFSTIFCITYRYITSCSICCHGDDGQNNSGDSLSKVHDCSLAWIFFPKDGETGVVLALLMRFWAEQAIFIQLNLFILVSLLIFNFYAITLTSWLIWGHISKHTRCARIEGWGWILQWQELSSFHY